MLLKSTESGMSKARHPFLLPRCLAKYSLLTNKYSCFTQKYSLLTNKYSLFTKKYSLLTNNQEQAFLPLLPVWDGAHQAGLLQWQVPDPQPGQQGHTELHQRTQDEVLLQGDQRKGHSLALGNMRPLPIFFREDLSYFPPLSLKEDGIRFYIWDFPKAPNIVQDSVPVHEDRCTESSMRLLIQKSVQVYFKCESYKQIYSTVKSFL